MKHPRLVCSVCILAVAVGALGLRLPRLGLRPMHGDEGNQAVKTANLYGFDMRLRDVEPGRYQYDPHDHHGPTLYYLSLPILWLAGADSPGRITDGLLRLMPALFGGGVVLLLLVLGDGLGRPAAVCAAVLTAISPGLVFYSRYYIQEMLLVFFTLAFLACAWRYTRSRRGPAAASAGGWGWAVAAGASLGLMFASKETWVLAVAAAAVGLVVTVLWSRRADRDGPPVGSHVSWRHVGLAAAAAALVWVTFFTSFFTHARGPLDSILAYLYYVTRAGGVGLHDHPWYFYLGMLTFSRLVTDATSGPWWSEGLILGLAVVGMVAAVTKKGIGRAHAPLLRLLTVYALVLTVAYAVIPYKTPWCAMTFLHGYVLLAGVGAAALVRWMPKWPLKALVAALLVAGAAHLAVQAHEASFRFCVDQRNPYVYAHTSGDAVNIVKRVEEVASVSPYGHDMIIKVITPENYWPLPWYLRGFNQDHIGYYHEVPDDCDASVILTTPEVEEAIDKRLKGSYNRQSVNGLRPGVFMRVYVEQPLWDALLKKWSAPKTGPTKGGGA